MIDRYAHPTVAKLWSLPHQYALWAEVEKSIAIAQSVCGIIPSESAEQINLMTSLIASGGVTELDLKAIGSMEQRTGHDLVAFLEWTRDNIGDHGRWLHYGVTSSDIIDTALGMRFAALQPIITRYIYDVLDRILSLSQDENHACLAYTHGEPAEVIALDQRFEQWRKMISRCSKRLQSATAEMKIAKVSGPTGNFRYFPLEVEQRVAINLRLQPAGTTGCQIVPRDNLANWANSAAEMVRALGKIALDFRLMSARGEVHEGWPKGRIGSSSMPHKRNPVNAEKLSGMGRLATGYASMLQPVDLWDERDISHSCVERIAVPDLWHVLFHSLETTADLLADAEWDKQAMAVRIAAAGKSVHTAAYAYAMLWQDCNAEKARKSAIEWAIESQEEE